MGIEATAAILVVALATVVSQELSRRRQLIRGEADCQHRVDRQRDRHIAMIRNIEKKHRDEVQKVLGQVTPLLAKSTTIDLDQRPRKMKRLLNVDLDQRMLDLLAGEENRGARLALAATLGQRVFRVIEAELETDNVKTVPPKLHEPAKP